MESGQHVVDVITRAAKTLIETFAAVLGFTNLSAASSAKVGIIGAVISAVWTTGVKLEATYKTSITQDIDTQLQVSVNALEKKLDSINDSVEKYMVAKVATNTQHIPIVDGETKDTLPLPGSVVTPSSPVL